MTTEEQITDLKKKIRAWDATPMMGDDPEIIELREMVIEVHTICEIYLNFLIAKHISDVAGINKTRMTTVDKLDVALFDLTKEVDFARLVGVLKEYNLASAFAKKLYKVNDLRVQFSHITAKQTQINAYKDRSKYLEAVKVLNDALEELKNVTKTHFPDTFAKIKSAS